MTLFRSTLLLAVALSATVASYGQSQAEMNITAGNEVQQADAELNTIYNRILNKIAKDSLAVSKLKTAERAWIAYRDAFLEANFPAEDKQLNYGTMYPMSRSSLRAQLTWTHLGELKGMLKDLEAQ